MPLSAVANELCDTLLDHIRAPLAFDDVDPAEAYLRSNQSLFADTPDDEALSVAGWTALGAP